jgi:hypothetical protein
MRFLFGPYRWPVIYVLIVLAAMLLFYTIPRWIWGWGLDLW